MFACGVCRHQRSTAQARNGCRVDDGTAAVGEQMRHRMFNAEENAAHVDSHYCIEVVHGVGVYGCGITLDARVVKHSIEPAKSVHGVGHQRLHGGFVPHVRTRYPIITGRARQRVRNCCRIQIGRNNACLFGQQPSHGGRTNATTGPGYDEDLTRESFAHLYFP